MPFADVNGAALRYELSGQGPDAIVLVHEMGGTLESWDALLPHLSADQRILRFDLRGSGLSEKLCGPLANPTLDDMAQDLAQLLAALAMDGPVRLAGCAVGARIALAFAARQPTRVAALVAMAPSLDLGAERARNAQASIARVERDGLRVAMRESLERMFAAPLGTDPRVGRTYILRHAANDATSYGAIYRMLLNSQLADQLPSIRCPCLILAGDLDTARPTQEIATAAATIPGAVFETLHSGHFMHLQSPELVGARLRGFFGLP